MKIKFNTVIELTDDEATMLKEFIEGNADLSLYDSSQSRETKITQFCLDMIASM